MSTTRKPRPVEALIRGETADERLTMLAIQVDRTMHLVETMARLLLNLADAADNDLPDDKAKEAMEEAFLKGVKKLSAVLGEQ